MSAHLTPPIPAGLPVVQSLAGPDRVTILAAPESASAACPARGGLPARVHSRHTRHLAGLPPQGHAATLEVRVRRFRCPVTEGPRRVLAERLPGPGARARRAVGLAGVQRAIARGTGGEPGSRLATRLAMPVSGDRPPRLIRAAPIEAGPPARIVGIDDRAWRRGRRYGTLVVDPERDRPIEPLPDRRAGTVAAWPRADPAVTVVARDRAGAYAEGARGGAPRAVQVADRWHLLGDMGDALRGILDRHHRDVRAAARETSAAASTGMVAAPAPPSPRRAPSPRAQAVLGRRAAREAVLADVAASYAKGPSVSHIARSAGLGRETVRVWPRLGQPPAWREPRRGRAVDRHAGHLRRRWAEGCRDAAGLWREIRALGLAGQAGAVRDRPRPPRGAARRGAAPPCPAAPWRVPSGRHAARLVVADDADLDATERRFVGALVAGSEVPARVVGLARRSRRMVRERRPEAPDPWIADAGSTALRGLAGGLRRDLAAARAALSSRRSTSPVEGRVGRLRTIRRQMYGRAGFGLLRHRVLASA